MKTILVLVLIVVAAVAQESSSLTVAGVITQTERLELAREYTIWLTGQFAKFHVRVDAENDYNGSRDYWVWVYQPDGKSVLMRPDEIPDKIIRSELVPLVQTAAKLAIDADRQWVATNPGFKDQKGNQWSKVPKVQRVSQ